MPSKISSDIIYNFMLTEFPESVKNFQERDDSYKINSIFISDNNRHLHIFAKGGNYKDFKTGETGNFWWFVKKYKDLYCGERKVKEFLIKNYRKINSETAEILKKRIKETLKDEPVSEDALACEKVPLPEEFHFLNKKTNHSKRFFDYLNGRGITVSQIKKFKFCYCISGKYKNRIILPVFNEGDFVYFMARDITDKSSKKYLNPKREEVLSNGTGKLLFNYDFLKPGDISVITEGTFNCLHKTKKNYVLNAVFGKAIGKYQLEKIKRKRVSKIVLAYDNDKFFNDSTQKSFNYLISKYNIPCEIIDWTSYELVFDEKLKKMRQPQDFGELYKIYKELPIYTMSYRDYIINKALGG